MDRGVWRATVHGVADTTACLTHTTSAYLFLLVDGISRFAGLVQKGFSALIPGSVPSQSPECVQAGVLFGEVDFSR